MGAGGRRKAPRIFGTIVRSNRFCGPRVVLVGDATHPVTSSCTSLAGVAALAEAGDNAVGGSAMLHGCSLPHVGFTLAFATSGCKYACAAITDVKVICRVNFLVILVIYRGLITPGNSVTGISNVKILV